MYFGAVGLDPGVGCGMSWAMPGGKLKVTTPGGAWFGMLMVGFMLPPTLEPTVGVMILGRPNPGKPTGRVGRP